jgi:tRNA pseudouridine55 synthase
MPVLVVDKPVGPTSYDVVRRVQRALGRLWNLPRRDLKVGHGGTLDPLASGVLPICIGEGTKLAPFLLDADKEYEALVRFGIETDTQDAAGAVVAESATDGLDAARVSSALEGFRGAITQVPPMYSALKHQGRALYSYARAGEEIPRAARQLTIFAIELLEWQPPDHARLRVRCSKGTYVRVLAADLGRALGPGGHLAGLRRTASGPFVLAQAQPLEQLEQQMGQGQPPTLIGLSQALVHLVAVIPPAEVAAALWQGKKLPAFVLGPSWSEGQSGRLRILRPDGSLLAVATVTDGVVRTLRGFRPESEAFPGLPSDSQGLSVENVGAPVDHSGDAAEASKLLPTAGLTSSRIM